jgi:hypothetical protein
MKDIFFWLSLCDWLLPILHCGQSILFYVAESGMLIKSLNYICTVFFPCSINYWKRIFKKKKSCAGLWWLMPVILVTWELRSERSQFKARLSKRVFATPPPTPCQPISEYNDMHLSFQATWEAIIESIDVPGQPGKNILWIPLSTEKKKLGVVAYTCHPSITKRRISCVIVIY